MNRKENKIDTLDSEILRYKILLVVAIFLILLSFIYLYIYKNKTQNSCKNAIPDKSPLNFGLVLYYQFNNKMYFEKNNRIICDLSGNKNNGLVYDLRWNPTGGESGQGGFEFNGKTSEIKIKNSDTLSPRTYNNHFTVTFFVKFTNISFIGEGYEGSYVNYLGKAFPNGYEWEFRQYNSTNNQNRSNRLSFYAFNSEGGVGVGGYFQDRIIPGEWIYITGVVDGDEIKIYKNGILRNTQRLSEGDIFLEKTNSDVYVGTADKKAHFSGSIDELRIYNRSLSNLEIKEIYNLSKSKI